MSHLSAKDKSPRKKQASPTPPEPPRPPAAEAAPAAGKQPPRRQQEIPGALRFKITEGEAAYRQVAERMRRLILDKALPVGLRLPNIKELAEEWGTNYFTAQSGLAQLIKDGLLSSRPGCGTVVVGDQRKCTSLGIYFGSDFWNPSRALFFQQIYLAICRELAPRDIVIRLFLDSRPLDEQHTPFKPLLKAIDENAVQAVISMAVDFQKQAWVQQLPPPHSSFAPHSHPHNAAFDSTHLQEIVAKRLVERGCRNVAVLYGSIVTDRRGVEPVESVARRHGLNVPSRWIRSLANAPYDYERFGYEQFCDIWEEGGERPDAVVAYPIGIGRGVLAAVLQKGVRVPQELRLVLHTMARVPTFSPVPVDWVRVTAAEAALALIDNVRKQFYGEPHETVRLPMEMSPLT